MHPATSAHPRALPQPSRTRLSVPRAVVLPRPRQYLQVPALGGVLTSQRAPRAVVLPRPLQQLQMTAPGGVCATCRPVPRAAVFPRPSHHEAPEPSRAHVLSVHGQSRSRAHFNTSRCPTQAASEHGSSPHGRHSVLVYDSSRMLYEGCVQLCTTGSHPHTHATCIPFAGAGNGGAHGKENLRAVEAATGGVEIKVDETV